MNNQLQMLMQLLTNGSDPNQMVQQFISFNPNVSGVFNQLKASGMSTENFVKQFAQQNNIDINPLVDMLSKRGIRL